MSTKQFTLKLAAKKIAQVYREEGITKLWKGNTATVLRVIPYSATQFASFRGYSHLIVADDYTPLTPLQRFIAGAGAGATATIITYPFDFLRTRMAVKEGEQTYKNIVVACKSIYKSEVGFVVDDHPQGILTFYTGIYAALFGVLPYSGISWMVFDSSRQVSDALPLLPSSAKTISTAESERPPSSVCFAAPWRPWWRRRARTRSTS